MLDWKKSTPRPNIPLEEDELTWQGRTADGFFYLLDYDDTLKLMSNNMGFAFIARVRCVKYDDNRRFRLYSYKPHEWELDHCPPGPEFSDNRWYFVNRLTKEVYVANHNGETIKKALEGTEALL